MTQRKENRDGKKLILVIDDDANLANVMRRILENDGFDTVYANNGFEAGVCLGHYEPDLITLDIQMPEMDGGEVLDCIRRTDYLNHLKVLVVSGLDEDILNLFMARGADDFLNKPFANSELLAKVHALTEA
jgi:CheY-like chemotaxis protein